PDGETLREQSSRCMNCGVPFCHAVGCPLGNPVPDVHEALFRGDEREALNLILQTNNFPEFTGRLCPAMCEAACVNAGGVEETSPVTVRQIELALAEKGWSEGWIQPSPPEAETGKRVAVIGSGPAGLAAAQQLRRAGHAVTVFEKDDELGGILRYGIPDFKLEKSILDRRLNILKQEGILFVAGTDVGAALPVKKLRADFSAVCLTGGSRQPRDLAIPGRELRGVYFAMEFLTQSNLRLAGKNVSTLEAIDVCGKKVVVIGGGDTGADCVGVSLRQGAASVAQIEVMPKPPDCRTEDFPWPRYPLILRTSTSHEEGGQRDWAILTKRFSGENNCLKKLECVRVEFVPQEKKSCALMREIAGSTFDIEVDVAIIAVGFLHPEHGTLLDTLGVAFDQRGNVQTDERYMSSVPGVFAAGDLRRGQSLIVWAIREGRCAAHHIDAYIAGGRSSLPVL
ncbi:MAG: glutamate synthase subunit beta, partial [Candidatus Omnitrophica bacterium]|nr:glutamate synthase subunit beta [Candidatus Omnitrophota bacterium]